MGKVVKIVAAVVGVAALVIPGVGTAIGSAIIAGLGTTSAAATIASIAMVSLQGIGLMAALQTVAGVLGLGPKPAKTSAATTDRLTATLNPREYRKSWVGHTAGNCDVRYQEYTGSNQEYLNSIIVTASHAVQSIDEIWFDDALAWSSADGVASKYSGYLWVTPITEGTTGNAFTITGSTSWVSWSSRFVGCSYVWLRYKLTGNSKNAESPFSSSVPSRITIRGRGAKLYDPRLDSTAGGSGAQRADDQGTWAWPSDNVGRNPALQLLWFLLGWRIKNPLTGAWKLAVGIGLPPARIDIPSFIAAANLCDETVTLAVGGTEKRYRADGVWSEGDDPSTVFGNLLASMNGVLRDAGGKLSLDILHNDLGTPLIDLGPEDLVDAFTWLQSPPIDQTFTTVRGKYVDGSDAGLYQLVDYPDVSIASEDGIERSSTFDLSMVQSASQAQRLAKTYLQRAQFPGTFSADFLASAWRCQVGRVVRLTFPALGFENKLFRVIEHTIRQDGTCPMVLREEAAPIYAWDAEEQPAVVAAPPITYNPLNDPLVQGIGEVQASVLEAIALAASKGKVWTTATMPAVADSNVGDTWIDPADGTFYERVSATGILLGGKVVVLDGKRPILPWKLAETQVLRDAKALAGQAYTDANAAIDAVAGLADDGILSINEKITKLIPESARLADKWASLSATAAALSVSTSAASSARTAWLAMLAALSPAWNDITQDTPVVRATYDGARDAYDAALYALAQAIDAKAATLSHWSGVADDDGNKPDDNATVGAPSGTNVGSTPATTVEAGANAGNAGLNSDGSVKGGKVLTASLANASVVGVSSATVSSISTSSFTLQDALSLTVTPDATDPTKSAFLILVSIKGYCRSATQGLPFKVAVTNTALTNSIANPDPTNSYSALTTYETVVSGLTGATTFKLQFCLLGASTSGAVIEEATITAFELKKTLP